MKPNGKTAITVEATIKVPTEKVWNLWTAPEHIVEWNHASDDWHTPRAQNDLRVDGTFLYRMESKDGNMGFDFDGVYTVVETNRRIEYVIADGRKVRIDFEGNGKETKIVETFEAEGENSIEMQRNGWQAILDNFKQYAESVAGN
ncbi:SRPBCC family protein [Candidatus Peregrinibacteria bacterium]|nr:SRPBCC family protein [Candidatus Peregrinibacteria bacterium]